MKCLSLLLVSLLLLIGCSPDPCPHNHTLPKYVEVECPECHGIGQVKADAGDRVMLGLVTFGLGAMVDTKQCDMCHGDGVVRKRVVNDTI